jgi:hypothetical protein
MVPQCRAWLQCGILRCNIIFSPYYSDVDIFLRFSAALAVAFSVAVWRLFFGGLSLVFSAPCHLVLERPHKPMRNHRSMSIALHRVLTKIPVIFWPVLWRAGLCSAPVRLLKTLH